MLLLGRGARLVARLVTRGREGMLIRFTRLVRRLLGGGGLAWKMVQTLV